MNKPSQAQLFDVINNYSSEKPKDEDSIVQWNQYYKKLYSIHNINWKGKTTIFAISASSEEEISQFVASVNNKDFILPNSSSFELETSGDFSHDSIDYQLYFIIDDNTARYTDGSVFGVRGERFGTIDTTSDEISEELFVTENQHKVNQLVNNINSKFLQTIDNGTALQLTADGTFTVDRTTYLLSSVIDENTANYTTSRLFFLKQTSTFGIRGEFFGRIENNTIVEKIASTYDYRLVNFVDDVNNSSLVNVDTLELFVLDEDGSFTYNGQILTPQTITDDTGIPYSDGNIYRMENNQFGYLQNNNLIPIAIYASQDQLAFIQNINNAQLTLTSRPDSIFTLLLSGNFEHVDKEYQLEQVLNPTTARYNIDGNSTVDLRLKDDIFAEASLGDAILMNRIYAIKKSSQADIDIFNQLLRSRNMVNYQFQPFTLDQLEPQYTILNVDNVYDIVYLREENNPYALDFEIKGDQFGESGEGYIMYKYVYATVPSSPETTTAYINTINNYKTPLGERILVGEDETLFRLDQKADFIYKGIQHNYFYNINETISVYSYTDDGTIYTKDIGLGDHPNGGDAFGYINSNSALEDLERDKIIASIHNNLSHQVFIDLINDASMTLEGDGQILRLNPEGYGQGDFSVGDKPYSYRGTTPGALSANYLLDGDPIILTLRNKIFFGDDSTIIAVGLDNNEQNESVITSLQDYNFTDRKTGDDFTIQDDGSFIGFDDNKYLFYTPIDNDNFKFLVYDNSGNNFKSSQALSIRIDNNDNTTFGKTNHQDIVTELFAAKISPEVRNAYKDLINGKLFISPVSKDPIVLSDNLEITHGESIYKPLLKNGPVMEYVRLSNGRYKRVDLSIIDNFYGEQQWNFTDKEYYIDPILGQW